MVKSISMLSTIAFWSSIYYYLSKSKGQASSLINMSPGLEVKTFQKAIVTTKFSDVKGMN